MKRILEVVLAFGNYMNRGNRSNALGFRVNSLNKMVDTKSSIDKKITLIHYLLTTIEKKVTTVFPRQRQILREYNRSELYMQLGLLLRISGSLLCDSVFQGPVVVSSNDVLF